MVEDRITNGKRIAQLLASELTGLVTAPLDRITVVDATPDAEPTPDGTEAYGVALDGERIGTVTVSPDHATLSVRGELSTEVEPASGLTVDRAAETVQIRVDTGAAVKGAVDLLVSIVSES